MKIKNLKPNHRNPRKMSKEQKEALKASMNKFGELNCIVFNKKTGNLISGHQRVSLLSKDSVIKIEKKYDNPTKCQTIAEGYIDDNGEKYKYREVDANEEWEAEALLAANGHSGEWVEDKLRVLFADFPRINISMTGLKLPVLKMAGLDLSNRPADVLNSSNLPDVDDGSQTDEQYAKNSGKSEEQIDTEKVPNGTKSFDEVEEKPDIVGKRFVIIIDCLSEESKQALKDKIKPLVEEASCKFF